MKKLALVNQRQCKLIIEGNFEFKKVDRAKNEEKEKEEKEKKEEKV